MSKFWKNLERAITLYALGMNPIAMRFMSTDEVRALLYDDKE